MKRKIKNGRYMEKRTKRQIAWSVILLVIGLTAFVLGAVNLLYHYGILV